MVPIITVIVRRTRRVQGSVQIVLELTIHARLLPQTNLHGLGVPLFDGTLEIQLGILRIDLHAGTFHRNAGTYRQGVLIHVSLLLDPIGGNELTPSPIDRLRTQLKSLIGIALRIPQTLSLRMFQRQHVAHSLVPTERQLLRIRHLQEQAKVMVGRTAVAIDVDYETPFIPMGVSGDAGILGFLTAGIAFLGVVGNGVGEFARGRLGLGLPVWDSPCGGIPCLCGGILGTRRGIIARGHHEGGRVGIIVQRGRG
mmetsp:Transcript_2292/g.4087  ORF Transcript_2292/g.4087 Transcript_2292/m.4087 type:complete len:254 (+) Transcript_2292:564-1325(+)